MTKAIVYGAGNIGRGFIGQLFSQSGYEVVFFDNNAKVIDRLNRDLQYPIWIIDNDEQKEEIIKNVRGVNSLDIETTNNEIATADIMALSVGVNMLPQIVKTISEGLIQRWESGNFQAFNIIICENLINANRFLDKLFKKELTTENYHLFEKHVGLVEASIGRMVPIVLPEMQHDNPLRVSVESYCELPVDKDAFKGELPKIVHLKPFSPFSYYVKRKLFMHNMAHCISAYLGFYEGKKYLWEACDDSKVKIIVLRALFEVAIAISEETNTQVKPLYEHAEELLHRFGNRALGDTIARVGRDPIRKLAQNDRLLGAATLCQTNGIKPVFIAVGIAAGFVFNPFNDEFALKVQNTIKERGIENAIFEFCGINASNPVYGMIIYFYGLFRNRIGLKEILEKAEECLMLKI